MKKLLILGIYLVLFSFCTKETKTPPISLSINGPLKRSEFLKIKDKVWTKIQLDSNDLSLFNRDEKLYMLAISNNMKDTTYVKVSSYYGNVNCRYFCFNSTDNDILIPTGGELGYDDFEEFDTIFPKSTKKYFSWMDISKCELLVASLEIKSKHHDSLNAIGRVEYFWDNVNPITLNYPIFQFNVINNQVVGLSDKNIQKELNKSRKILFRK